MPPFNISFCSLIVSIAFWIKGEVVTLYFSNQFGTRDCKQRFFLPHNQLCLVCTEWMFFAQILIIACVAKRQRTARFSRPRRTTLAREGCLSSTGSFRRKAHRPVSQTMRSLTGNFLLRSSGFKLGRFCSVLSEWLRPCFSVAR